MMTRYTLHAYSGPSFYPDRTLTSLSRRRVERRALLLRRQGFATVLLPCDKPAVTGPAPSVSPRLLGDVPELEQWARLLENAAHNHDLSHALEN